MIALNAASPKKIAGQGATSKVSWPKVGASIGISRKTRKTKLINRAISAPSNRSRTIETTSTRVAAADAPCKVRATSNRVKLFAAAQASAKPRYRSRLAISTGLRP
jgi:hypothetical protein